MTPSGDHLDEMNVTDPELDDFLDELSVLVDVAAPPPSDELEALFTSSLPLAKRGRPESRHRPVARRLLTPLAAAAAVVAMLVIGAATHDLPAPAQRLISKVVNTVTPFHIDPDEHPAPAPSPSEHPRPGAQPGSAMKPKSAHPRRSVSGSRVPGSPAGLAPVPDGPSAGSIPDGEALGHGKAHGHGKALGHSKAHGHGATSGATPAATHGRSTAPGQVGRTGIHGGGRPAPPPPVPAVSISASAHGNGGSGVVPGTRFGAGDQYTKSVRNALPKHRSGSLAAASARKSSSRG